MPTVRRELTIDADPDTVWDAVSTEAGLETWLADGVEGTIEPGQRAVFTYDGGERREAVIEEVLAGERIAWSWVRGEDSPTRVVVAVSTIPAGSRITVTETGPLALAAAAEWSPAGLRLLAALRAARVHAHA